jgi:Flp pilus assembly pilin Flp
MASLNAYTLMVLSTLLRFRDNGFRRTEGQTMAEYALILAGIAVVAFVGVKALGPVISDKFDTIGDSIATP